MERMTWIKPSFLWMMYRSGWGQKDQGQKRILAIDITREGFEWALNHSFPTQRDPSMSVEEWKRLKEFPVQIQWDPERSLRLGPLPHRAIQIGLSKEAVTLYTTSMDLQDHRCDAVGSQDSCFGGKQAIRGGEKKSASRTSV